MEIIRTFFQDALLLKPRVFGDQRGFFMESYNKNTMAGLGVTTEFVQDNHSLSKQKTLRGLHYQTHPGQAKLVRVTRGRVLDVFVDIRPQSPTLGKWDSVELSEENQYQLFLPVGFAHGFLTLSSEAEFLYKCSSVYNSQTEAGIRWDDPLLNIDWPCEEPLLSDRDRNNPGFDEYLAAINANSRFPGEGPAPVEGQS